jgi:uncharacterized membrane protein
MRDWSRRYWKSFSFVGLVVATLFFSASITPSLLPRNYIVQGLLSGFAIAVGYGVGICGLLLYEFLQFRQPADRLQRNLKIVTTVVVAVVFVLCLRQMTFWQNSIRQLMDVQPLATAFPYRTALIALLFGACLIAMSRLFGRCCVILSKKLNRFMPPRVSTVLSVTLVGFISLFLINGVIARGLLNAADAFFLRSNDWIDHNVPQPVSAMASGSDESLISWQSIGRQGKDFVVEGPTANELSEFWGSECPRPLRVYVGMQSRETTKQRAQLALQELKRVGGFKRSVLVVATPTGTGWLDPGAVDTLEYLHGGDTAIVSIQYSYLPSWMTIIVDPQRSIDAARTLFDEVYSYWKTLPASERPELYLFGLSLGALGSEVSADLYTIFEDPIQGAVWSGPPFPSSQWSAVTAARQPGTPAWLPKYRDGAMLRFTAQQNALATGQRWGSIRNVYIQYASDPMVFFSPSLLWKRPPWLNGQRGPDVSPHLKWYPLVTFLQLAFDLPMATSVPLGYGHNYSPSSYIDAWIAVTQPANWQPEDTARLKERFRTPAS